MNMNTSIQFGCYRCDLFHTIQYLSFTYLANNNYILGCFIFFNCHLHLFLCIPSDLHSSFGTSISYFYIKTIP